MKDGDFRCDKDEKEELFTRQNSELEEWEIRQQLRRDQFEQLYSLDKSGSQVACQLKKTELGIIDCKACLEAGEFVPPLVISTDSPTRAIFDISKFYKHKDKKE